MTSSSSRIQSLKLGSAAQLLPILFGFGTQLLTTPYVVSKLGLHDFGIWALTGALAQYAALLDLGVSRAANRFVALFHAAGDIKRERAVVGICTTTLVLLGALLAGLVTIFVNPLSRVLHTDDPSMARYLLLCAVLILIAGMVARMFAAASAGRGRYVPASVGVAILSSLQAVGGASALAFVPTLTAFAGGTVAGTISGLVIVSVIILVDERRIVIGMPNTTLAREIVGYGLKSQIAAAGDLLLLQSGKLIAGLIVGPAAAGVYELASRLAMGAQMFGAAPAAAITPHLTRGFVANGMTGIERQYEHLTRRNTAVAIFVPLAAVATAYSAIPLWLGNAQHQVVMILLALLPGIAINVSTAICSSALMAVGRPSSVAQVTVVGGLAQTILAVCFAYIWGMPGIAVAFLLGVPAAKLLGLLYMHKQLKIPANLYFRAVAGPYGVGVIATIISIPIGIVVAPVTRIEAVWPFVASLTLFVSVYCVLGWKFHMLPRVPLKVLRRPASDAPERETDNSGGSE